MDAERELNAAKYIRENKDNLITEWEGRARAQLRAAQQIDHFALTDRIPLFIEKIAQSLEKKQPEVSSAIDIGEAHAFERSNLSQFSFEQVLAEYKLLLQVVFDLLSRAGIHVSDVDRNVIIDIIHYGKTAAAKKYNEQTSRALQEAEEFRRRMLESSEDCFKVLDLNGVLIDITERSLAHLEFENAQSVLGKSWVDLWSREEDRSASREAIEAAKKGSTGSFVGHFRTKSGKREWWDVTISPMNDETGRPEKLLAVSRDVTEQKKAIEQLELSEFRFRQMFEQSGIGKVITDPETKKIIQANESFCRLVGYTEEELQRMTFLDLTYSEDLSLSIKNYEEFSKGSRAHWQLEKRYLSKSGQIIWASIYATSLRDPGGKIVVLTTIIDINEQKKIEAEKELLLNRLETLQVITEAALSETTTLETLLIKSLQVLKQRITCDTMAILLLNEKQSSLEVRASIGHEMEMERKTQVPIGKGIAGTIFANAERTRFDSLQGVDIVSPTLRDKNIQCLIGVPLKVKGKVLGVLHVGRLSACPFNDGDLDLLELVSDRLATAIDNAQLYEKLVQNIGSLEFERAMREQFVNTLSHDLRNPLTTAKMSAYLIARSTDPEKLPQLSERMINSIDRVDQMIQDLLDANRIRAGHPLPIQLADCDLIKLTTEVIDEFKNMHGDRFTVKMPEELSAHISCKDYTRLLENLMGNAVKYGAEGKEIDITLIKLENNYFQISVHNWGNPIPEDKQQLLFSPFSRAAEAESCGRKGWGLGLTLVRGVAEAHGGEVTVKSNESEGTTFSVVMPLHVQKDDLNHKQL